MGIWTYRDEVCGGGQGRWREWGERGSVARNGGGGGGRVGEEE